MKGIILAGGTATRLFPLTATTSKQLLPIYDRQMIFYPLNTLVKAGIEEILMIVSPDHAGQFLNLLGSTFKNQGIRVVFDVQRVPKGLPEAFVIGEHFMDDDNVTMVLGDNIFADDVSEDISSFEKGGRVFALEVPDPERSGVVEFDDQMKVLSIEEKPEKPKSNFIIPGLYVYDNRVCEIAKNLTPSKRMETEIVDLHKAYLDMGELDVRKLTEPWIDAGTIDSLLDAQVTVRETGLYKKFDPRIDEAIQEFNIEIKKISKKKLA